MTLGHIFRRLIVKSWSQYASVWNSGTTRAYKRMGREGRIMMIITVITIIMKIL